MKRIATVMAIALMLCIGASATPVTFSGTTTGSYSGAGSGLTFNGGSFGGTTTFSVGLGSQALSIGGVGNNFGTFSLAPNATEYSGTFTLTINISAPGGTVPNPGTASVQVFGTVNIGQGPYINWNPSPVAFSFSNAAQYGSFYIYLNTVAIHPGDVNQQISGLILAQATNNPVPEPASLVLMGSGLLTGGGVLRRKLLA